MNRKNLLMMKKISNSVLRERNWELNKKLHDHLHATRRYVEIQNKMDEVVERALGCGTMASLVVEASDAIREQFGLSSVTFCLAEGFREVCGIYASGSLDASSPLAEKLFFASEDDLNNIFASPPVPLLRGRLDHGSVHAFGIRVIRRIKSEALVPLLDDNKVIGSLNIGSSDPLRYEEDSYTDYLRRLGQIFSLIASNMRLRHYAMQTAS